MTRSLHPPRSAVRTSAASAASAGPPPAGAVRIRVEPFRNEQAATIAAWVNTPEELLWLAPATPPPLSVEKVLAWMQPNVSAFAMTEAGTGELLGYAELNRMERDPHHQWIGHVIIRRDLRGRGLGVQLVKELLKRAMAEGAAARVSLIVCPDNTAAVECYKRAGFEIVCEEVHRFGRPPRRLRMLRLEWRA